MKRTLAISLSVLLVLASVAGVASSPAIAASDRTSDELTPGVERDVGFFGGYSASEDVVRYGAEGNPGWVVFYEEGHADDLAEWADASSKRVIQHNSSHSRLMVISAPKHHVGLSAFGFLSWSTTLRELAYVEQIGVNRRVNVNPISGVDHKNKSAWSKPKGSLMAVNGFLGTRGAFDADGAAWSSEVNTSSLDDARAAIDADEVTEDGSGVRIAILDTGLDYDSDLYGDRVVAGRNEITNETLNISDPANATASDYEPVADGSSSNHGSWIATAIAGNGTGPNATGVAPGAEIVPVKVLGDDGSGTTENIAAGLEYACGPADADIVSMSLGSPVPSAQIEAEIVSCLEDHDVSAVVVAAGNSRLTYRYLASPGDESPVVTVAATDAKAVNESESAYFSNVGPDPETAKDVDVGAPGMKVTATTADGDVTLSGTSMATPLVSGSIALAIDADDSLRGNPEAVRLELAEHAEPMPEAGVTEVGDGRVNARWLVEDVTAEEDQEAARTSDATARDEANEALAGSFWRDVSSTLSIATTTPIVWGVPS